MGTEEGGNLSDLWSAPFPFSSIFSDGGGGYSCSYICPFSFSNVSSQDLVSAKRRVSIFDKLRKNSKGVSLLLYY